MNGSRELRVSDIMFVDIGKRTVAFVSVGHAHASATMSATRRRSNAHCLALSLGRMAWLHLAWYWWVAMAIVMCPGHVVTKRERGLLL